MLKSGDPDLYRDTITRLQSETSKIVHSVVELTWYMRGGLQYPDALNLTRGERDMMRSFIESRMEKQKDQSFPVY